MKNTKRILLKLSGQTLESGDNEANLDFAKIKKLAVNLKKISKAKYQLGIVVGAGNIFRARMVKGMEIDRVAADHMGMMATIINALALQSVLEKMGQEARVLSSFSLPSVTEDYSYTNAINHLENNRIVIFAGGTGNPYFTTDTAAILRALEVGASRVLKATQVDGVYSADPRKDKNAKLYKTLSYYEALEKDLQIMDSTAFALAQDNNLKLSVFKYSPENIVKAALKNNIGTKVK